MKFVSFYSLAIFCFCACTKPGKNVTIEGRVMNPITGEGIEGIELELLRTTTGYNGYEETFNRIEPNSEMSEKLEVTSSIILYPNPSNDGTFSLQSDSKITSVIIYNIYGMLIQESDNLEMVEFHSTKILTTGTYLIKTTIEEKSKTFKLVVL